MHNLPQYMYASPVGVHILYLEQFLESDHIAPHSSDPERCSWSDQAFIQELGQLFPATSLGRASLTLLIYNKSRDVDRICPCCRRWYHAGEPAFGGLGVFTTFDEFIRRPPMGSPPDFEHDEVAREQNLSGICSRVCMGIMNAGDDSLFGVDLEHVTPEQISRHSPLVEASTGWKMRMTTPDEEASMGGAKLIYYK